MRETETRGSGCPSGPLCCLNSLWAQFSPLPGGLNSVLSSVPFISVIINHLISHLCCEARPCLHPPALLIIFLRDDYWGGLLKTGELCFWCPLQRFFRIGRVLWAFLVLMYIVVHLFLLERSEVYPSLSAVADSMMKVDVYLTNLTLLPLSTHCTSGECTAQSVSQYTSLRCFTPLLVGKYECYRVELCWSRRWTTQ